MGNGFQNNYKKKSILNQKILEYYHTLKGVVFASISDIKILWRVSGEGVKKVIFYLLSKHNNIYKVFDNSEYMSYFEIKIQPTSEGSSDVILIDNFHPRWKEGARKLLEGRIIELMENYTKRISKWSDVPMNLEFSHEYGLNHISLPFRSGLDLWARQQQYKSHNIHSVQDVGAVVAVASHYIGWLNFAIRDLSAK